MVETTEAVMVVIGAAIAIIVGIWVTSVIISSNTLPSSTAYNESINFAANNTAYAPTNTYFLLPTNFYDNAANTVDCYALHGPSGTGRINVNSSGFYIRTNGTSGNCSATGGYNLTAGVKYITYTYQTVASNQTMSNVQTTVWNSISLLAVALIVIAAASILAYFGFGMNAG